MKDVYSLATSRGLERVMKISAIDDNLDCGVSSNVWLDNSATSDSFYEAYGYSESYGSTFNVSNFECGSSGDLSRTQLTRIKVVDNHSYYTELFVRNPSSFQSVFNDLKNFNYDSIDKNYNSSPIDAIPNIFIEYFLKL